MRNVFGLDGHAIPDLGYQGQIMPRQSIRELVSKNTLLAQEPWDETQFQPASVDLRLGHRAWRVRASFLTGRIQSVKEKLKELNAVGFTLENGAVLERGCVYVVELIEHVNLPPTISAVANPKSSTGRLDVFTRLITDFGNTFDHVPGGYRGRLYAEVSPCSFSIKVQTGSRLNQLRLRQSNPQQTDPRLSDRKILELHIQHRIVNTSTIVISDGLHLHVDLYGGTETPVGYKARRYTDIIDVDKVSSYEIIDFWETITDWGNGNLILDPSSFYILASREKIQIPSGYAAEMAPIDPSMGEFRVHYAGFFDPGFGSNQNGLPGSQAVFEVRSHEVPAMLQDGQPICRLAFEKTAAEPDVLYGQDSTSNYQGQGLRLSKHFR